MTRATARTTTARTTTARTTTARTTTARTTTARVTTARATTARTNPSRPELRLVPGAAPASVRRPLPAVAHRRAPFVLLVLALLVGTTLGLLVLNTAIAVDSLKATSLKAANAQRVQEVQRLQQEVTNAGTPQQIAAAAKKAGLIPAGNAGYLVLGSNGQSTLRGTPEPAAPSTVAPAGG